MFDALTSLFTSTPTSKSKSKSSKRTHAHYKQAPDTDTDAEALLPPSLSSSSTTLQNSSDAHDKGVEDAHLHGVRIAVRTALLCAAVYASVGIALLFTFRGTRVIADQDEFCLNHVQEYSPLVKQVKPNWHTVRYNGSFFHASAYRQDAGPEVDAAWEALGVNYRSIVVPASEAERTGLRHDQVKVSQLYGGGFPANVEGLHHLHCLNLLRQSLHWNYPYYLAQKQGAFINSEYVVRYHVTHCLDILRQQLMCVPDIGVLGQVWYHPESEPKPIPFVDFNTKHRCRDYEAVREWAERNQLPPETEVDMTKFYEMPKDGDTVYPDIP